MPPVGVVTVGEYPLLSMGVLGLLGMVIFLSIINFGIGTVLGIPTGGGVSFRAFHIGTGWLHLTLSFVTSTSPVRLANSNRSTLVSSNSAWLPNLSFDLRQREYLPSVLKAGAESGVLSSH